MKNTSWQFIQRRILALVFVIFENSTIAFRLLFVTIYKYIEMKEKGKKSYKTDIRGLFIIMKKNYGDYTARETFKHPFDVFYTF